MELGAFVAMLTEVGKPLAGGLYSVGLVVFTLRVIVPLAIKFWPLCPECRRRLGEK